VAVGIRLRSDCRGAKHLKERLLRAEAARVSGWGYHDAEDGVFFIDCLCEVELLPSLTPVQLRRMAVPY